MRTLSPGESWMCVLDRQWVRPQQRAWGTAELCCSWLCPWALLCCACCCHSSLQGSGKLLGSWNRDLELILQLVQDLSGFVSPSCCSAIRFLGVLEDSSMDPQPSLVTSLGHFLGAAQTEQCCPGLVKVFSADQRRLHTGAVQDPLWCLLLCQVVSSHRTMECQAGRDCLQFLGAGCSMACLERGQCDSNMPVLLFQRSC